MSHSTITAAIHITAMLCVALGLALLFATITVAGL